MGNEQRGVLLGGTGPQTGPLRWGKGERIEIVRKLWSVVMRETLPRASTTSAPDKSNNKRKGWLLAEKSGDLGCGAVAVLRASDEKLKTLDTRGQPLTTQRTPRGKVGYGCPSNCQGEPRSYHY